MTSIQTTLFKSTPSLGNQREGQSAPPDAAPATPTESRRRHSAYQMTPLGFMSSR